MTCCQPEQSRRAGTTDGMNKFFTRTAKKYAKTFRRKGLDKSQRLILEGLRNAGFGGRSILEIGCGVGGLHLTMMKEGAASAFGVEVSEGMLEEAQVLAAELGMQEHVRYVQADFVAVNDDVPVSDIVVLDKVLCCYEKPLLLIRKSTEKAHRLYAVSYPRDAFLAKMVFTSMGALGRMLRWSFHPFYHQPALLDQAIMECGFSVRSIFPPATTALWQVKVFERMQRES
jgi:magnesium-protoporphyrin O-methyltransferase